MRLAHLALACALIATPAAARDILLPLNDQEQTALRAILDLATKAGGIEAARATLHFAEKMQALQAAPPPAPPQPPPEPPKP